MRRVPSPAAACSNPTTHPSISNFTIPPNPKPPTSSAAHLEHPVPHNLEAHYRGPLLHQRLAGRRHGAGADAADVGVVAAAGGGVLFLGVGLVVLGGQCVRHSHSNMPRQPPPKASQRTGFLLVNTHLATKKTMAPSSKTGVMTVMSGRCDPPASCGWLESSTSPSRRPSAAPAPPGP